MLTTDDQVLP